MSFEIQKGDSETQLSLMCRFTFTFLSSVENKTTHYFFYHISIL